MKKKYRLKNLISDAVLYIIATGLHRGYFLIISPLLLTFLKIEEYGIFTLTFSVSQMFIPLLTLGGTAGILREGSEKIGLSIFLLERFIYIVFLNVLFLIIFYYLFFKNIVEDWVLFSIVFGALTAIIELFLSFYRISDKKKTYFLLTVGRIFLIILAILLAKFFKLSLLYTFKLLVTIQFFLIVWLLMQLFRNYFKKYHKSYINILYVLKYTFFIIPHGLALWIINSSDKLIIKNFLDNKELGIYSVAYTIASIQLLLNSGIGIALPQLIYKNYNYWLNGNTRIKVINLLGIASLVLTIIVIFFIKVDQIFIHLLPKDPRILEIIKYVIPALFLAGVYQYFSIYIFYHKKTKNIFYISSGIALFNIFINYILIAKYGILGASYTTLLSYCLYLYITIIMTIKVENRLNNIKKDIFYIITYFILLYSIIDLLSNEVIKYY